MLLLQSLHFFCVCIENVLCLLARFFVSYYQFFAVLRDLYQAFELKEVLDLRVQCVVVFCALHWLLLHLFKDHIVVPLAVERAVLAELLPLVVLVLGSVLYQVVHDFILLKVVPDEFLVVLALANRLSEAYARIPHCCSVSVLR